MSMQTRTTRSVVRVVAVAAVAALALAACGDDDDDDALAPQPEVADEAAVFFVDPQDGDSVATSFDVVMGAEDFTIEPAADGDEVNINENAGHLHIIVDEGCVTEGEVIPSDDQHHHYGDGSTATTLELDPGTYELCLQAADGAHRAYALTDVITITVE